MLIEETLLRKARKLRSCYATLCKETELGLAAFRGGDALYDKVYPYSPHEDGEKLANRRSITLNHYDNYPKEVANIYIEGVYKSKQDSRSTGNERFDEFLNSTYYNFLLNEVHPYALNLPELYLFFEQAVSSGEEQSREDDKDKLPYAYLIFPQYVHSFGENERGELEWIAFKCKNEKGEYKDLKVITDEQIAILSGGRTLKKLGKAANGEDIPNPYYHAYQDGEGKPVLPVERIRFEKDHYNGGEIGIAPMVDVVRKSVGNLQYISIFIEATVQHLFPKLRVGRSTVDNIEEEGGMGSTQLVIEEESPNRVPTEYVVTSHIEFQLLLDLIYKYNPQSIYRAARLTVPTSESIGTGSPVTGIALLMKAVPQQNALSRIAEWFQQYDERIVRKLAWGYPITRTSEIKVKYPPQLEVRTSTETLTDITSLTEAISKGGLPNSTTAALILMMRVYEGLIPDMSADDRKEIEKELKAFLEQGETPTKAKDKLVGVMEQGVKEGELTNIDPATMQPKPPVKADTGTA